MMRRVLFHSLFLAVFCVCSQFALADEAEDAAQAEADLIEVRDRLKGLEAETRRASAKAGKAEKALRKAETSEGTVRVRLGKLEQSIAESSKRLKQLAAESESTRNELAENVARLEAQIRYAYQVGRDDWLRSVLANKNPQKIARQLVYARYLASSQNSITDAVRADLGVLDSTAEKAEQENQRLIEARAREAERLAELAAVRTERAAALTKLNRSIESNNAQIEQLRSQAADLQALVDELTRLLAELPISGGEAFSQSKGRLAWPVDGRPVKKFGQALGDGPLRADGVTLAASFGSDVRAVHHGRVVFADWLAGMGQLVIVEHGDGYLSLYGHNQDIVTAVGEWVTPESVIAHVGDSGGQANAGLYFELRKDGQPFDPGPWVAQN